MGWEVLNLRQLNFSKPLFAQFSSLFYYLLLLLSNVHAFVCYITFELLTAPYYCSYFSIAAVPPEFPPSSLYICALHAVTSLVELSAPSQCKGSSGLHEGGRH